MDFHEAEVAHAILREAVGLGADAKARGGECLLNAGDAEWDTSFKWNRVWEPAGLFQIHVECTGENSKSAGRPSHN
jgi:hypothetical protein